ncbi:MAG: class I SAM-dependent methyltransferase, partial [Planctomycetota bacterium]
MKFEEHRDNWDALGRLDPLWAIVTDDTKKGGGWDLDAFWETGRGSGGWVARHMSANGLDVARGRALDFGCGIGRLTQPMCKYFKEVIGVDVAKSMIEAAEEGNTHRESCRYVHNPSQDLQCFPSSHFDFVLSLIVLQHMPTQYSKNYIREFLRVLRPGGYTFFQLPSAAKDGVAPL